MTQKRTPQSSHPNGMDESTAIFEYTFQKRTITLNFSYQYSSLYLYTRCNSIGLIVVLVNFVSFLKVL